MKKLILLLGILSMGFQCEDRSNPIANYGVWYVKNATSRTLHVTPGQYDNQQPTTIVPDGTIEFHSQRFNIWDEPDFSGLLSHRVWSGWTDENILFKALSDNGTPLARWKYSNRDHPGRQFFNESSWSLVKSEGDRLDELKYVWVFEIKQDDL